MIPIFWVVFIFLNGVLTTATLPQSKEEAREVYHDLYEMFGTTETAKGGQNGN